MASNGKKWLVGCGAGCAAFAILMILVAVGGGLIMMKPFNNAANNQKELTSRFGTREEYIPPPDGLTPDRIKIFLTVRQELMNHCTQFEEIAASFKQMEQIDAQGEDPPVGQVLKGVGNVMGSVFSVAGEIGAVNNSRNNELLKNGMGLGEYTWIYILVFNSWLGYEPNTGLESSDGRGFTGAEGRYLRQMMLNHAQALDEAGRSEEAGLWRDESGRLERSEGGVPFAAGNLPSAVTAALTPFRTKLAEVYCPAMAEFDLGRVQKKGWGYRSE